MRFITDKCFHGLRFPRFARNVVALVLFATLNAPSKAADPAPASRLSKLGSHCESLSALVGRLLSPLRKLGTDKPSTKVIFQQGGLSIYQSGSSGSQGLYAEYQNPLLGKEKRVVIRLPGNGLPSNFKSLMESNTILGNLVVVPTTSLDSLGQVYQVHLNILDVELESATTITPGSGQNIERLENPGGNEHLLFQVGDTHLVDFVHVETLDKDLSSYRYQWARHSHRIPHIVDIHKVSEHDWIKDARITGIHFSTWKQSGLPLVRVDLESKKHGDRLTTVVYFGGALVKDDDEDEDSSQIASLGNLKALRGIVHGKGVIKATNVDEVPQFKAKFGIDPSLIIPVKFDDTTVGEGPSFLNFNSAWMNGEGGTVFKFGLVSPEVRNTPFRSSEGTIVADATLLPEQISGFSLTPHIRAFTFPAKGKTDFALSILSRIVPDKRSDDEKKFSIFNGKLGRIREDIPQASVMAVADLQPWLIEDLPAADVYGPRRFVYQFRAREDERGDLKGFDPGNKEFLYHYLHIQERDYHSRRRPGATDHLELSTLLVANRDRPATNPRFEVTGGERKLRFSMNYDFGERGLWTLMTQEYPAKFVLVPANFSQLVVNLKTGEKKEALNPSVDDELGLTFFHDPLDPTRLGWSFYSYLAGDARLYAQDSSKDQESALLNSFASGGHYAPVMQLAYDSALYGIDRQSITMKLRKHHRLLIMTGEQKITGEQNLYRILLPSDLSRLNGGRYSTHDFYGVSRPPYEKGNFLVVTGEEVHSRAYLRGDNQEALERNEKLKLNLSGEKSVLMLFPKVPDDKEVSFKQPLKIEFSGKIIDVEIGTPDTDNVPILTIKGTLSAIEGAIPVIASYRLTGNGPQKIFELKNPDLNPVFKNDHMEILRTHAFGDQPPSVWIRRSGQWFYEEMDLKFQFLESEGKRILEFLRSFFGLEMDEKEFAEIWAKWADKNTLPIKGVTLVGNDVLAIGTDPARGTSARTYFYSLSQKKTLFFLPNYSGRVQGKNYSFYVGQADPLNHLPSYAAVLDDKGRFLTHFNLGNLKLDLSRSDVIQIEGDLITFNLEGGERRVFDSRRGFFYGHVARNIESRIEKVDLPGEVLNGELVRQRGRRYMGRTKQLSDLESLMPYSLTKREEFSSNKAAALLVGPNSSGKSSAVREWMRRYVAGEWKEDVHLIPVFFTLDTFAAVSGSKWRGALAEKFTKIISEARYMASQGYRLVLLIEGLEKIKNPANNGSEWREGAENVFEGLNQLLNSPVIDVVATTTDEGLATMRKESPELIKLFEGRTIRFEPMGKDETIEHVKTYYREHPLYGKGGLSDSLLKTILDQLYRLVGHDSSPGAIFSFLDKLSDRISIGGADDHKGMDKGNVTFIETMASVSSYPEKIVRARLFPQTIPALVKEFDEHMHAYIRGQDAASGVLRESVRTMAYGTDDPNLPFSFHLLAGPTGVGKSESVFQLARFLGMEDPLKSTQFLFISGADYQTPGLESKLQQIIAEQLVSSPFSIILFDEYEKMHANYQRLVLALGDGRFSDFSGRSISSSHAMVFATSNLGSRQAAAATLGFATGKEDRGDIYIKAIKEALPPELLGRFEILLYSNLEQDFIKELIRHKIDFRSLEGGTVQPTTIANRVWQITQGRVELTFSDRIVDELALRVIERLDLGARALKKTVESVLTPEVNTLLGELLLQINFDESGHGAKRFLVDRQGGQLQVTEH